MKEHESGEGEDVEMTRDGLDKSVMYCGNVQK